MWRQTTNEVADRCRGFGLDLVQPLRLGWYNVAVEAPQRVAGRDGQLALLIGNTAALWPPFVAALRAAPDRLDRPDPLDRYVVESLEQALVGLAAGADVHVRWAHRPDPYHVAMQRAARLSGLAWLSQSNLCVHPTFGPWIGLRALVVVDAEGPPDPAPELPDACEECGSPCLVALRRAHSAAAAGGRRRDNWRLWLAVRDACARGREHRYSDAQIEYHYVKDRAVLRALIDDGAPAGP